MYRSHCLFRFCYFNPRSREGSDAIAGWLGNVFTISIHAPARGATMAVEYIGGWWTISIHAPARGATSRSGRGI